MSIASISANPPLQQLQSYFQQRKADLQELRGALQSGDLAGAQQAFQSLQTLAQSSPFANSNAFGVSQRQQDFAAVGQALQSGDLAGAQQAFAQLVSTFHHRPTADPVGPAVTVNISGAASGPGSGTTQPTSSSSSSSFSSGAVPELIVNVPNSGGPEQITIGVNNSSAGEQVTISVAGQQGTSREQITINLGHNSNEQIVLNLLNSGQSTAAQGTSPGSGVNVVA